MMGRWGFRASYRDQLRDTDIYMRATPPRFQIDEPAVFCCCVCDRRLRRRDMPSLSNVCLPRVQPRLGQFIAPNHVVARWAALVAVVIGERNRLGGPPEDNEIPARCRDQYGRGLMCYSKKGNSPGTRRMRRVGSGGRITPSGLAISAALWACIIVHHIVFV